MTLLVSGRLRVQVPEKEAQGKTTVVPEKRCTIPRPLGDDVGVFCLRVPVKPCLGWKHVSV